MRAPLVAVGAWYATFSLSANYQIMLVKLGMPPEAGVVAFERAAATFPFHTAFRMTPAYYQIYVVEKKGYWHFRESALASVENALKTNPNSVYLRGHLERMRQ